MKINGNNRSGSALIVMMILTVIIGVTLASYLTLVSGQNSSIMRSLAWNNAIPVAEAGVEEAMAHLNRNITNRTADGWTAEGTNVVKERTIGTSKYKTYISLASSSPTIISQGWVENPKTGEFLPKPRTVRVITTNDAIFAKGMVAKSTIDLKGNGIATDSYDPDSTAGSTDGRYDPAKRRDHGDIATNSSIIGDLNVGNAEIYGKASTGPGGNILLKNGTVGSLAHHASGVGGVEPGWSSDDMNVQFPDVKHPYNGTAIIPQSVGGSITLPGPSGTVNYDYHIGSGYFRVTSGLNLKNRDLIVMGHATLLVEGGDIEMTGNAGGIVIATNASLRLFMNGPAMKIAGQGVVNRTGRADAFSYWGMPNNIDITFQGNAAFVGTIYAPNVDFKLGGGGSTSEDFMGASITKTVTMNGHFKFHYDESLGRTGPRRGYTIVSWNEI